MDAFLYLLLYGISLVLTLSAGWYSWRMRARTGAPLSLAVILGQVFAIIAGYAILAAAGFLMARVLPLPGRYLIPLAFGLCTVLFA
jgi:hypothetical protein